MQPGVPTSTPSQHHGQDTPLCNKKKRYRCLLQRDVMLLLQLFNRQMPVIAFQLTSIANHCLCLLPPSRLCKAAGSHVSLAFTMLSRPRISAFHNQLFQSANGVSDHPHTLNPIRMAGTTFPEQSSPRPRRRASRRFQQYNRSLAVCPTPATSAAPCSRSLVVGVQRTHLWSAFNDVVPTGRRRAADAPTLIPVEARHQRAVTLEVHATKPIDDPAHNPLALQLWVVRCEWIEVKTWPFRRACPLPAGGMPQVHSRSSRICRVNQKRVCPSDLVFTAAAVRDPPRQSAEHGHTQQHPVRVHRAPEVG